MTNHKKTTSKSASADVPPYEFIDNVDSLRSLCSRLSKSSTLAIDTEFVGERSYYPHLELVQLSDGKGNIGLVDVQKAHDPECLSSLVADPNREKILHSGGQDVALLERYLGHPPLPMFDTQLAAAMTGIGAQVSYANLVKFCLKETLDKKQMVSDWSRRPLKKDQLDYAAMDVVFLHKLREVLVARLEEQGRISWFREEQARRAEESRRLEPTPDDELYTTVKEWAKLSGRRLAVLRELAAWRENEARSQNVPRKQILQDYSLIALSQISPSSLNDIRGHRQIPAGAIRRYGSDILKLVEKAKALPREEWPVKQSPPRPDVPPGFVELLQALVRVTAEEEQIAPVLLTTSAELTSLVNNRHRMRELDLPVLRGWRREMIGERLMELLEGEMCLKIKGRSYLVFEKANS